MKLSIRFRIVQLSAAAIVAMTALCGVLFWSLGRAENADRWVEHTHTVLDRLSAFVLRLDEAESAQQGYLLTANPTLVPIYREGVADYQARLTELLKLTDDNALQQARLKRMGEVVGARLQYSNRVLELAQAGDVPAAIQIVREGQGRALMDRFRGIAEEISGTERQLLERRQAVLQRETMVVTGLVTLGGGLAVLLISILTFSTLRRINRPLNQLFEGITALANGNWSQQVHVRSNDEIGRVSQAFNQMARTLQEVSEIRRRAEQELAEVNEKLVHRSTQLQDRGRAIDLVSKMAQRLQAVSSEAEFAEVVRCFAPQILPSIGGALYFFNNSRNLVSLAAGWNCPSDLVAHFAPSECWALRRGQVHAVADRDADVPCHHLAASVEAYSCMPLLAHGDIVGLLYLDGIPDAGTTRLPLFAENIALALANFRLQQSLREQSIRDPLTHLFNRRYLEESLNLELARANRSDAPLGLMMIDVDHFKRFNDTFGHDAGDTVLRAVGQALPGQVRAGDVVCRYGGEEFTVILPDADLDLTLKRAEEIRQAVMALAVRHQKQSLAQVTVSIGVAARPLHGDTAESLLASADAALYRAKVNGRNRVEVPNDMLEAAA